MGTIFQKKTVFHVDDEPGLRRIVLTSLQDFGYNVIHYETAQDCLAAIVQSRKCDLVVTDAFLSDMDGVTLLGRIREVRPLMPVIFITYFGTISLAVQAIKKGAIDFIRIEKPVDSFNFKSIFKKSLEQNPFFSLKDEPSLTVMEARILQLVANGKTNSEIAFLLECSVRTVECHRNRIMHKLGVDNLASLVKKAILLKLTSIIGT